MSDSESEPTLTLEGGVSKTKEIAVGIILVAVYAVLAFLPLSGFIGAGGIASLLSFSILITPLFGIILGPFRGMVMGLIAGILATFFSSIIGGGVYVIIPTTILSAMVTGLFVGLAVKSKTKIGNFNLPGPVITALYLFVIVILYLIPKSAAWWFISPYILAALIALGLQIKPLSFDPDASYERRLLQLLPFAFIGTMLDHTMMALGSVYILDLPADLFGYGIFPVMLIERIVATLICTVIATIVLNVFKNENWIYTFSEE
ncbi:MAG: hypothetical protein RTU92_08370 [Candidatus Thorarchaeota archaeon]